MNQISIKSGWDRVRAFCLQAWSPVVCRTLLILCLASSFACPALAASESPGLAVVLVEFPGIEVGLSGKEAAALLLGESGVVARINEGSFGKIQLVPLKKPVFGPVIIDQKKGESCDSSYRVWADRALSLLGNAQATLKKTDHLVFIFPAAEVLGCKVRARGELFGRLSWIFGSSVSTIVHELGHNFGLGHASKQLTNLSQDEYGDLSSPMGYTAQQQLIFNAAELHQLKWMNNASAEMKITNVGSYSATIKPSESYDPNLNQGIFFVSIQTPAPRKNYILSFRKIQNSMLQDARNFQRGISLHIDRGLGNPTLLVSTLSDGNSYYDSETGLRVIQKNHSLLGAEVEIILPASEGEIFVAPGPVPTEDSDNDGVEDAIDCAPANAERWNSFVGADADLDGIADSETPAGICAGDQVPPGYAAIGIQTDNCPGFASQDLKDSNLDGLGDVCTPDAPEVLAKYQAQAILRQAKKTVVMLLDKSYKSSYDKLLQFARNLTGRSLKNYPQDKNLIKADKLLESQTVPRSVAALINAAIISHAAADSTTSGRNSGAVERVLPCKIVRLR